MHTRCVRVQRQNKEALQLINTTLTRLIDESKAVLDAENLTFDEETFLSAADPSILHFLIAAGDEISSKQLRDDLMTMLIAGHETTAAVLTWTTHLLAQHPEVQAKLHAEVRAAMLCAIMPRAMPVLDSSKPASTTFVIKQTFIGAPLQ